VKMLPENQKPIGKVLESEQKAQAIRDGRIA
jgi:hypothetical protein